MNTEVQSIHAIGAGIVHYLNQSFQFDHQTEESNSSVPVCNFQLLSSAEVNRESLNDTVSFYLYRINVNEHLRNRQRIPSERYGTSLYVDLYYLCSFWFSNAEREQEMLAWVMHKMYHRQMLSNADTQPGSGFEMGDHINVYHVDLPFDEMSRIWSTLMPKYRLSLAYVARSVRIAELSSAAGAAVTSRRLLLRSTGAEP